MKKYKTSEEINFRIFITNNLQRRHSLLWNKIIRGLFPTYFLHMEREDGKKVRIFLIVLIVILADHHHHHHHHYPFLVRLHWPARVGWLSLTSLLLSSLSYFHHNYPVSIRLHRPAHVGYLYLLYCYLRYRHRHHHYSFSIRLHRPAHQVFLIAGRKRKKSATSNYLMSTGMYVWW